jgi:hypothetical protein
LVVFALLSTGLAGFDSYGPSRLFDRAIVTIWFRPVPPIHSISMELLIGCGSSLDNTLGSQKVIVAILLVNMWTLWGL